MRRTLLPPWLPLAACAALAFLFVWCVQEKKTLVLAPDFSVLTLDGQEITLSQTRGKAILLDFWATWCGPCRESIPHLVQLYKAHHAQGFEIIGLSMDREGKDVVQHFVQSMDIPYPIAIAPDSLVRDYGVHGLPTTILIGREGKIRKRIVGFNLSIAEKMASSVASLIAEEAPEVLHE